MPLRNKDSKATDTARKKPKVELSLVDKIEFIGVGTSASGDRFIKRKIGEDVALISVAKLMDTADYEYVRLQRAGVALLVAKGRAEFIRRVELEAAC